MACGSLSIHRLVRSVVGVQPAGILGSGTSRSMFPYAKIVGWLFTMVRGRFIFVGVSPTGCHIATCSSFAEASAFSLELH